MVSQQVQAVGLCIADVLSCDRAAAGDIVDHDVVAGVNFVDALQETRAVISVPPPALAGT